MITLKQTMFLLVRILLSSCWILDATGLIQEERKIFLNFKSFVLLRRQLLLLNRVFQSVVKVF
jgi:hypothetical protein